jgi:hypothetical protein
MGDETNSINNLSSSDANAIEELEEEFERELKRNEAALSLVRERAEEAKLAKARYLAKCLGNFRLSHYFQRFSNSFLQSDYKSEIRFCPPKNWI